MLVPQTVPISTDTLLASAPQVILSRQRKNKHLEAMCINITLVCGSVQRCGNAMFISGVSVHGRIIYRKKEAPCTVRCSGLENCDVGSQNHTPRLTDPVFQPTLRLSLITFCWCYVRRPKVHLMLDHTQCLERSS